MLTTKRWDSIDIDDDKISLLDTLSIFQNHSFLREIRYYQKFIYIYNTLRVYKFFITKWFPYDSVTDVGCEQKRCSEQTKAHKEFKLAKNILPKTLISMQNCIIYRNQYMIWGRLSQILKMHPKILTLKWFGWKEVVHFLSFVKENHWTRNTKNP